MKSNKIEFDTTSHTKEDLLEIICGYPALKEKVNLCNMGDIYSSMDYDKIIHKGFIYEKVCRSSDDKNGKMKALFQK